MRGPGVHNGRNTHRHFNGTFRALKDANNAWNFIRHATGELLRFCLEIKARSRSQVVLGTRRSLDGERFGELKFGRPPERSKHVAGADAPRVTPCRAKRRLDHSRVGVFGEVRELVQEALVGSVELRAVVVVALADDHRRATDGST